MSPRAKSTVNMEDKTWNPATVFDLFGDTLARQVLVLASEDPISATELADQLDVSPPTVYRRTDELLDHDFLAEYRRVDESGNHYRVFETTLERVDFEIADGGYNVDIRMRQTLSDRFEAFWAEFERSSGAENIGPSDRIDRHNVNSDPP